MPFSWWRLNKITEVKVFSTLKWHLDVKWLLLIIMVPFSKSKLCSGFAKQTVRKGINFRKFISQGLLFEDRIGFLGHKWSHLGVQWKFPPWHLANESSPPPKLALPSPTLCIQAPSWTTLLENMIKAAKTGGFIGNDSEGHSLFFKGGS